MGKNNRNKSKFVCNINSDFDLKNLDVEQCDEVRVNPHQEPISRGEAFFGNKNFLIDVDTDKKYREYEKYSYNKHFSTHDWLAYISLLVIKNNPSLVDKWNKLVNGIFWSKDMEKLYLWATAAPDYPETIKYKDISYVKTPHLVRFRGVEKIDTVDFIAPYFTEWGDRKTKRYSQKNNLGFRDPIEQCNIINRQMAYRFQRKEYDKIVFLLGGLAHFIGDCACMPHLFDYMGNEEFLGKLGITKKYIYPQDEVKKISDEFEKTHTRFQWMLSERTDGKEGGGPKYLNNPFSRDLNTLFEFFYFDIKDLGKRVKPLEPKRAAEETAKFTYSGGKYDNNDYMFNNYGEIFPDDWRLLPILDENNKLKTRIRDWLPDSKKERRIKIFLEKIQDSLKSAVINITCAFDYIIDNRNIY